MKDAPAGAVAPATRAALAGFTMKSLLSSVTPKLKKLTTAALLSIAVAVLFASARGQALLGDALPYTQGFLVTGNYVVGGVDLKEEVNPVVDGFSEGTIEISDVPPNADIVAAYLFWESITLTADESQASGVQFRGFNIDINDGLTVKKSSIPLAGSTTPCWSSGVPLSMRMYRADVLRFLPMQLDKDNKPTGKRVANSDELPLHGYSPHTVKLPVRIGNEIPESAGASLVVIYRDPAEVVLRKIVIYDGIHVKSSLTVAMDQSLQGFYKSALLPNPDLAKSAKLTHIVASGQPNNNDQILFKANNVSTVLATNPFVSGSASQRSWANPTYDVGAYMVPGSNSGIYGETVDTQVRHQPSNGGIDCLAWGAVVFSTVVADEDHDGLPDFVEDTAAGVKDPDGKDLPNLKLMGAGSDKPDLFVEVNAMQADAGTWYGEIPEPPDPEDPESEPECVAPGCDPVGHNHMPTPEVLNRVGDAYCARDAVTGECTRIRPHFDVGDPEAYHDRPSVQHSDWIDNYAPDVGPDDEYLVPCGEPLVNGNCPLARGGEMIKEVACDPAQAGCHFPDWPGTVLWRLGFLLLRDMPVADNGDELTVFTSWNAATGRRRFDPTRRSLFHYVMYAHARAWPKSLPCLVDGEPAPYDTLNLGNPACTTPNPDFDEDEYHIPSSSSGFSDLPGGNAMVTLGLWDEFVARPFVRASTTLHELGHNLELWHGGAAAQWGNKAVNTANYFEPNCKTNYLSSMSYLFQVHGLFDDADQIHADYSHTSHNQHDETEALNDDPLSPLPLYQPAWFAPPGSLLAVDQGAQPATRFCTGINVTPPAPMARVHASSTSAWIDWNGDTLENTSNLAQDVNFDGQPAAVFNGFDDWGNTRLNQIGAEGLFTDGGLGNFSGGIGNFSGGLGGFSGGIGGFSGGIGGFSGGIGGFSGGIGGFSGGIGSFSGGLGGFSGGIGGFSGGQEMTYNHAKELGKSRPSNVRLCIIGTPGCQSASPASPEYHRVLVRFDAIPVGEADYQIQRKRASDPDTAFVTVGDTALQSPPKNVFIDPTELVQGYDYTYRVRAISSSEGNGPWSMEKTITAVVNDAPAAANDGIYQVNNKATLTVPSTGNPSILANDVDGDSPTAFRGRRAVLVSGPTVGTLTCVQTQTPGICSDGSFKFTPPKGSFLGLVFFTYKVDDGLSGIAGTDPASPQVPLSDFSNTVTVTINVFK